MLEQIDKRLEEIAVSDLSAGWVFDDVTEAHTCLFCGTEFMRGVIYPIGDTLYDAEHAVLRHIKESHGDVFELLLQLGKDRTGVSPVQRDVLRLTYAGLSDKEIARELGGKSPSTVRNHQFQLRKRKREAKIFLALMDLLEEGGQNGQQFVEFHGELSVADDRTIVTEAEAEEIIAKAFEGGDSMALRGLPKKQKGKLVVLNRIVELFELGRNYTEKQVNDVLAQVHWDYVTIRRYLIDYGLMTRAAGGSDYRRL
jgi:hypothetical protein